MKAKPKKKRCPMSFFSASEKVAKKRLRRKKAFLKRQEKRRQGVDDAFADFCKATDGEAHSYVNNGEISFRIAYRLAFDDWARKTATRYFRLSGKVKPLNKRPRFKAILASLILCHFILLDNSSPAMSYCALALFVKQTKRIEANIKHRALRPRYYEKENVQRKKLKPKRKQIIRRTKRPCPSKEAILDAYIHHKDSKESAICLGQLIQDLEYYVNNDLRFEGGRILGRNTGIKGWLKDNIPLLESKYSTIMRYKVMVTKQK